MKSDWSLLKELLSFLTLGFSEGMRDMEIKKFFEEKNTGEKVYQEVKTGLQMANKQTINQWQRSTE